jgi:hypothetical protein
VLVGGRFTAELTALLPEGHALYDHKLE